MLLLVGGLSLPTEPKQRESVESVQRSADAPVVVSGALVAVPREFASVVAATPVESPRASRQRYLLVTRALLL